MNENKMTVLLSCLVALVAIAITGAVVYDCNSDRMERARCIERLHDADACRRAFPNYTGQ